MSTTIGVIGFLAGCGSPAGVDAPTASSATVTVTQTVTATPSAPEPPGTTQEEDAGLLPSATATGVLPPTATGRPLSLSEFFKPDQYWKEDRYDIASQTGVQGIGIGIQGCGDTRAPVLELRLGNSFSTLAFTAGQANDSGVSDRNLVVEVLANNRQIDIQRIPFNKVQQFSADVRSVNALKVRLYAESATTENCGYSGESITGVISGAVLS